MTKERKYMFEIKGKYNTAKVFASTIDDETTSQIMTLCNQEWTKESSIAIMADTHAGKGCTIGTTMTIHDKVCPNLVGVDIGCGMLTVKLPKEVNDLSLPTLDAFINKEIPSGFSVNDKVLYNAFSEGLYLEKLLCYGALKNIENLKKSVGSLGGGNHFVEIDEDDDGQKYLVIHTGSRNLGKQVAEYYQKIAEQDCNKSKENRQLARETIINHYINLQQSHKIENALKEFDEDYQEELKIQKDLCFLQGQHKEDYLHDMYICQRYAEVNRKYIALNILEFLFKEKYQSRNGNVWIDNGDCGYEDENLDIRFQAFETVHNYISPNDNILRKGAIDAAEGKMVLIPINMRDGAIIGIGKGNAEYNSSGPHGAGRLMSRSEAKRNVALEDFEKTMKGIYSTSVGASTLDESPMAYKPIEDIIDNIEDTVVIFKIIKPIYNFKAH